MSLLTHLILAAFVASAAAQCTAPFFESGGACFTVIDMPGVNMTWAECRGYCQDMTSADETVDIATFDDAEHLEAFSTTWLDVGATFEAHPYMWIGVEKVDGNWEQTNGQALSLQSNMWEPGHPHEMGEYAFLNDITMSTGVESYGRLYIHCSMGVYEHHSRCLCRAS